MTTNWLQAEVLTICKTCLVKQMIIPALNVISILSLRHFPLFIDI